MREIIVTRQNLEKLSKQQRHDLTGAIAEIQSHRHRESDELPHNRAIQESNIRQRATEQAANRFSRIPSEEEIRTYLDSARAEIQKQKQDYDWYYGQNVLSSVGREGQRAVSVPDNYIIPWREDSVVSITEGMLPKEPSQPAKVIPFKRFALGA